MYLMLPLYAQVTIVGIVMFEVVKRKYGRGFSYSRKQKKPEESPCHKE
jgi:hypothetical protein